MNTKELTRKIGDLAWQAGFEGLELLDWFAIAEEEKLDRPTRRLWNRAKAKGLVYIEQGERDAYEEVEKLAERHGSRMLVALFAMTMGSRVVLGLRLAGTMWRVDGITVDDQTLELVALAMKAKLVTSTMQDPGPDSI